MAHGLKPLFKSSVDEDSDIKVDSLVFDVSYLAHKYAHALSRFKTREGNLSGHVYGVFKHVKAMAWTLRPKQLVFAYDRESLWRSKLVASYKQDRKPKDADLMSWTPSYDVERLLRGFPGVHLSATDAEADDMIAWFSENTPLDQRQGAIAIVSADRDLWQLIDDQRLVSVVLVKKPKPRAKSINHWIKEDEVAEEFGVPPAYVARIKAVLGDPSDSIAGLTGASRPGKKDALRKFVVSPEADDYFDSTKPGAHLAAVPDWLGPELLTQRDRILANNTVADLKAACRNIDVTPFNETGNVAMSMDALLEFECESLLSQVAPFFETLEKRI